MWPQGAYPQAYAQPQAGYPQAYQSQAAYPQQPQVAYQQPAGYQPQEYQQQMYSPQPMTPDMVMAAAAAQQQAIEQERAAHLVPTSANATYNLNSILANTITASDYYLSLLSDYHSFESVIDAVREEIKVQ